MGAQIKALLTVASQDSAGPSSGLMAVETDLNSESMPPFSA